MPAEEGSAASLFFFSSRRRHTRCSRDWSSDVCSSDLRQGLYEVMALTSPLRRAILKGASTEELREMAVQEGMLTLRMDGMVKGKKGITTLEEVVKETAA